jgi:hypothetical protein
MANMEPAFDIVIAAFAGENAGVARLGDLIHGLGVPDRRTWQEWSLGRRCTPSGVAPFGFGRDLSGKPQRDHDQRFAAISADNQQIVAVEPFVQSAKSAAAAFDFDAAINAEQRHAEIAAETSARRPGERDALSGKPALLQEANKRAFAAISFWREARPPRFWEE